MDITIAGYTLAELREQRQKVAREANAFIANAIEQATSLAKQIAEAEDAARIETLATEALGHLQAIETVSTASGVEYYLPNRGDNCYDPADNVITRILRDTSRALDIDALNDLIYLAEDMENQTDSWNASYC
jgi:hypothetical protein